MGLYNILDQRLQNWAKEFVELYITKGEYDAANWAMVNIPEEHHHTLHKYVNEEFTYRGYEIVYPGDEEGPSCA